MIRFATFALAAAMLPATVLAQSVSDDPARQGNPSFSGHAAPGPRVASGQVSLTGSEATMSPRFFRSGTPGDACSTFSSGNFQYTNIPMFTDGSGQVTANFDPQTCGTGIFVTFHSAPLNPTSICEGFIWSFGSSQAFTETFNVPANSQIYMVVSGVANAPGVVCGPATYSITGANAEPPAPAIAAPALDGYSLSLLALVIGLVGAGAVLRRK